MKPNPCLTCGACCAYFRVSFYWSQCDDLTEGGVPIDMTEDLTQFRRVMKGTKPSLHCTEGYDGKRNLLFHL